MITKVACEHPYEKVIVQTIGAFGFSSGEYWDNSKDILICRACGLEITDGEFERSRNASTSHSAA